MYNPCGDSRCDGHLVPEHPERLTGPEVGDLCVYRDLDYPQWHNTVVRVILRSYVWSPEMHTGPEGHGYRHYDWSVIETSPGKTMVVDDDKLVPLVTGTRVEAEDEAELVELPWEIDPETVHVHVGHHIEVVVYAGRNLAIQCEDCGTLLGDIDFVESE